MAKILQTETEIQINVNDFTLISAYSGETNPNISFDVLFTVLCQSIALENVEIEIGGNIYFTDSNGQSTISLNRGDYQAILNLAGYSEKIVLFTILDQNIVQNIQMDKIGSFDDSYDNSYEKG